MILAGQWDYPQSRRDDAYDRGYDPSSAISDRTPGPPLDAEWQEALDTSLRAFQHIRDEDGDDRCGIRCDRCDDRMCALQGPEPRACGTTCTDCPCACAICRHVAEDMRADLLHQIERESA